MELRYTILAVTEAAGAGHTGGSLSMAELITVLYFYLLNVDPADLAKVNRDRFILSKGHATPGYYSALALRGYFAANVLRTFDQIGSPLQAHPDMHKCPGVDYSTGSLGQGLSIGIGMAMGGADAGRSFRTVVLLGDGELQEGQVWEAAMYAGNRPVRRLIAVLDYNKVQLAAATAETLNLEPLADKWKAFNWQVLECQGNDISSCLPVMEQAFALAENGPVIVAAHTVKGKGVSFMENTHIWHGKAPDRQELLAAFAELDAAAKSGRSSEAGIMLEDQFRGMGGTSQ